MVVSVNLQLHPWVTRHGAEALPTEDENCVLVEVTEEEVENSVKHIPSLATVVRDYYINLTSHKVNHYMSNKYCPCR